MYTGLYITKKPFYLECELLSWFVLIRKYSTAWLRLKATLQCSRHRSAHSGRCTCGWWKNLTMEHGTMFDFGHSLMSEEPIFVGNPLHRWTQITPRPYFSSFSLSCLIGIRPRSVTWRPIVQDASRRTFWTSCIGVIETSFLVHNA